MYLKKIKHISELKYMSHAMPTEQNKYFVCCFYILYKYLKIFINL